MSHLGRPYPWAQHYDCWEFSRAPRAQLAQQYKGRFTIPGYPFGSPVVNADITSDDVEYLYTDVLCRWKFQFPAFTPDYFFYLELMHRQRLDDVRWRYTLFENGVQLNQTRLMAQANSYGDPTVPGTIDWNTPIPPHGLITINIATNFVPW